MAVSYEPKDIDRIFDGIRDDNDRAAIAVVAAIVEYALERAIRSRLREPRNKTEEGMLFSEKGIINTLSEKIQAAYFLRIIGPKVRRDLDLIREIRNQAAHDMNEISFQNTEKIANRCRELVMPGQMLPDRSAPPSLRDVFVVAAQLYTTSLLMRSYDSDARFAAAFARTLGLLDQ